MILAIDIGNTNIVIGCFQDTEILFTERLSTNCSLTVLEYAVNIKTVLDIYKLDAASIHGGIISSVVPQLTNVLRDAIRKITHVTPMIVGPGVKTGLNIRMDNPAQVGSDRIVNAVAGIAEYPVPLVLIDLGTATTICVVDEHKNYIGGMILPGVRISLDSLVNRTSQLRRISLDPPRHLIGKNTEECMKSGLLNGNAACLDGMIDRIQDELGQPVTVIATGGLAPKIIPLCRHSITIDDELLLKGMRLIYYKNI